MKELSKECLDFYWQLLRGAGKISESAKPNIERLIMLIWEDAHKEDRK